MDDRTTGGGRFAGVAALCAGALACVAGSGLDTLKRTNPPQMEAVKKDLVMNIAFDSTDKCPAGVAPDASSDPCPSGRQNCGRAHRGKKVTFVDPGQHGVHVYFDPSRAGYRARTADAPGDEIPVDQAAAYIDYKFSITADTCPGKVFDPIIIVQD